MRNSTKEIDNKLHSVSLDKSKVATVLKTLIRGKLNEKKIGSLSTTQL